MTAAELDRYEDVRPPDSSDLPVLEAVRRVLEEHGCLDRFGVTLLHSHFDLQPDEVLVETTDYATRTLTIQPMVIQPEWDLEATATSWSFNQGSESPVARLQCFPVKDKDGNVIGHVK